MNHQKSICKKCGHPFPKEEMHIVSAHDPEYGARLMVFCKACDASMLPKDKIPFYKETWDILLQNDRGYYSKRWESFSQRILGGA